MRYLFLICALVLSSCSLPPPDAARLAQAEQAYGWLRDGDVRSLEANMLDEVRAELTPAVLAEMRAYTTTGEPIGAKTLSWRSNVSNSGSAYQITRLYDYPQRDVLFSTSMFRRDGRWLIGGLHINAISDEQAAAASGFSLENKSPVHYATLAAAVLVPIFCLVSAGVAGWRRRWGWMVLCLFGVTQFSLNWATGGWGFQPINVSLLGAAFAKGMGPLDPWILSVALPLPAILFWAQRRYRPKLAKSPPPQSA